MAAKKAPAVKARPQRPDIERPSVLVCHEKHGELYFHIPDEAALHRVALDILTKRLKSDNWYYDPKDDVPVSPGLTKDQLGTIPDGPIKAAAKREIASYENALQRYERDCQEYGCLVKAVQERDGKAAWQVLRTSDGEYQRITLERYADHYYESV